MRKTQRILFYLFSGLGPGKEFVMRLRRTDSMIPGEEELIMAAGGPLSEFECKNLPSHQVDDVIMHEEERTDRAEVPYFKDDHFECFPPDDYVQVEKRIGIVLLDLASNT